MFLFSDLFLEIKIKAFYSSLSFAKLVGKKTCYFDLCSKKYFLVCRDFSKSCASRKLVSAMDTLAFARCCFYTFGNLKDLIYKIVYKLFGENTEIRFRPSYFPFTEPSAEVDILSEDKNWLEILGCGIVNPVVLENCKIDSNKFSGLAFGLGIERIAMLKYGVSDIRDFYKSNLDFLKQFK